MTPPAPEMGRRPTVPPCVVPGCPGRATCLELQDPRHCALYRMHMREAEAKRRAWEKANAKAEELNEGRTDGN